MKARLVVLASGQGTNLQALLDACRSGALAAEVVAVASHNPTAHALRRAQDAGATTFYSAPPRSTTRTARAAWDADLARWVAAFEPDLIVLAGWMRIVSTAFLDRFPGRVVNLHPALPGELPGLNAIARAHDEARTGTRRETGVMVHYAVPEVDAGPVIVSERVPIDPEAPLEALEEAIHAVEHRLIVEGVRQALAAGAQKHNQG